MTQPDQHLIFNLCINIIIFIKKKILIFIHPNTPIIFHTSVKIIMLPKKKTTYFYSTFSTSDFQHTY